ncbi:hypothetical protein ACWGB8_36940, partial [Kitasatospora sp. NPDC054939]
MASALSRLMVTLATVTAVGAGATTASAAPAGHQPLPEAKLKAALLTPADLVPGYIAEPPGPALGATFVSGDAACRDLVDLNNRLGNGTVPGTAGSASTLLADPVGSFVWDSLNSFRHQRAQEVYRHLARATANCKSFVHDLPDGQRINVTRVDVRRIGLGDAGLRATFKSETGGYTVETTTVLSRVGSTDGNLNTRQLPGAGALDRIAATAVARVRA